MEYTSILSAVSSSPRSSLRCTLAIAIRRSSFYHFGTRGTPGRGSTIPTGIFRDLPAETTDGTRHDSIPIAGRWKKKVKEERDGMALRAGIQTRALRTFDSRSGLWNACESRSALFIHRKCNSVINAQKYGFE